MQEARPSRPFILVLAGVNGAGKSSVGGALIEESGLVWFNPDAYTRELMAHSRMNLDEANARAWEFGRASLESSIKNEKNFAFETTLGARTIPDMLMQATRTHDVSILFCGLSSPELHIQRVKMRVAHGGHDIPEARIRERWTGSRANLIRLLPRLANLQVFDNSAEAAPGDDIPDPLLVLECIAGKITFPNPNDAIALAATPDWARPIVQAAIEAFSA